MVGLEFQVFRFVEDHSGHLYFLLGWCGPGKHGLHIELKLLFYLGNLGKL